MLAWLALPASWPLAGQPWRAQGLKQVGRAWMGWMAARREGEGPRMEGGEEGTGRR